MVVPQPSQLLCWDALFRESKIINTNPFLWLNSMFCKKNYPSPFLKKKNKQTIFSFYFQAKRFRNRSFQCPAVRQVLTRTEISIKEAPASLAWPHPFFSPCWPVGWCQVSSCTKNLPGTKDVIGYLSKLAAPLFAFSLVTRDARVFMIGLGCFALVSGYWSLAGGLVRHSVVLHRADIDQDRLNDTQKVINVFGIWIYICILCFVSDLSKF